MSRTKVWASGDAYEPYVGRWSRLVARELLAWLGAPPGGRWLDVGSGTGALSAVILEAAGPREVVGVDRSAGYVAHAIDVPTVFRDFDDYWSPFLGGQAPAPGYCMALPEDRRRALRERLRAALPIRSDGGIHLVARAWATRGRAP